MANICANEEYFDLKYQTNINLVTNEVIEARGDRSTIDKRISCISNFASPNAGGIVSGNYYDACFHGSATGTLAGAANRFTLSPYYSSNHLVIDQIGVLVSTAVASALGKIVIYENGLDNWPDTLLFESSNLDFSTTGFKSQALSFTFDADRQYWLGIRESSTATLRTISVASAVNLGVAGATGTSYYTVLRRTITFANPAPTNWAFVKTDLVANTTPPSIRMRAA